MWSRVAGGARGEDDPLVSRASASRALKGPPAGDLELRYCSTPPGALAWQERTYGYDGTVLLQSRYETLKHIFQKNAIEFETRATRHEQRATSNE